MASRLGTIRLWLLLALLSPTLGAAGADTWRSFHGDARNSGFTSCDAPFDSLLDWSYVTSDSIGTASPVVGPDETIYIGNADKELVAVSFWGRLRWTFRGEGNFRSSTPAIASDGTLYVGGADGRLYAIGPDGSRKWTFLAHGGIRTSPNIGEDGTIYFGCDDGRLYAVNPDSTRRWVYATADTIRSSPAIGPDGTIFVGSYDGHLYAIWPDGSLRWSAATGGKIKYCSPAVSEEGNVYIGSYDGFVYAFSSDREFLWAYFTDHVVRSSPAIGPEGRIYVGAGDRLLALDAEGHLEWDYSTGGTVISSPAYWGDDDVIGFGSTDGVFYCLHEDGGTDWTFTVGEPILSSPAASCWGNIYIADSGGTLWSFGAGTTDVDPVLVATAPGSIDLRPNPTRGWVELRSRGARPLPERILVHDASGRRVTSLATGGQAQIAWDGSDRRGVRLPVGIYYVRAPGRESASHLMLIR